MGVVLAGDGAPSVTQISARRGTIAEFFGLGGTQGIPPRHHRPVGPHFGVPGPAVSMWTPAAGTYISRAEAVETVPGVGHLGYLAGPTWYEQPRTAQVKAGPDGQPVSGAWLPGPEEHSDYGQGQPRFTEDNDAMPPQPRESAVPWNVLVIVALGGLITAALFVTDRGDF